MLYAFIIPNIEALNSSKTWNVPLYKARFLGGSRNDKKPTEGGKAPICRLVSRAPKRPSPPLVAGRIDPLGEVKLRRIRKNTIRRILQDLPPDSPHQPKEPACPHLLCPAEPLRSPPDLTLPLSSLLRFNSSHGRIRGLQSPFQSSKIPYLIYGKRRVLCYILGEEKDEKRGRASGGSDR